MGNNPLINLFAIPIAQAHGAENYLAWVQGNGIAGGKSYEEVLYARQKMNQAIEDLLWDFCDEFGFDLPMDKMDLLIENTIKTAMSRY